MTLENFQDAFLEDENNIMETINNFLKVQIKPSESFDNNADYNFSWKTLSKFLNQNNYGYSRKDRMFIKGFEPVKRVHNKNIANDNLEIADNKYNESEDNKMNELKTILKLVNVKNETVSATFKIDKEVNDRLSEICKDSLISKNKLVSILLDEGLKQLEEEK